ncbi:multi-sensor signal transduction histidine kinase [Thalassoporum mexicanum PCC 7367]|uniref:PAS domain S-box protein n=1 Tax=Thalassoporum mexicanum TaxID=3457544 RepID=UPI00029FD02D|nr:PAS domain S-box protein [Pseudanabaena sp. PCC 7367]AFY68834.1 multi-sensor signal transduction histidine kinase [Pseudanabaena sp. PCC 7367]
MVADAEPKRILIVEDQGAIALNICDRLREIGYQVVAIVSSGEKAIAAVQEMSIDLVLMDIEMANGLDGIHAAKRIREIAELPVVFLTAHSDRHTIEKAKHTGAYGYVTKPFQAHELLSTIETALARHQLDRQTWQREQWLVTTLGSISEGVITTDLAGLVTYINPRAVKFTGYSHAFAKGRPIGQILKVVGAEQNTVNLLAGVGDRPLGNRSGIDELMAQIEPVVKTKPLYLVDRSDRQLLPIEINVTPIRTNQARINGVVFVLHDVSSHLEIEVNLRKLIDAKTADIRDANYKLVAEISEKRRVQEILFQHLERLENLYQMVFALGHASDSQQIYTAALTGMQDILGVSRASLMIAAPNGDLQFGASQGLDRQQEQTLLQLLTPHPPEFAVAGNFTPGSRGSRDSRGSRVQTQSDDTEFLLECVEPEAGNCGNSNQANQAQIWSQLNIGAIASFSLIHQNKLLGRILVYYQQPPELKEEEVQLGKTAANFIAMAIARTNAVAELSQSEAKFRSIYNQAAVGISYHDLAGNFELVNQSLCQILGYSRQELLGQSLAKFIHQEDFAIYEVYASDLQRGQLEQNTFTMESRFITKSEQVIWCNLTMSLLRSPQGTPEKVVGIVEDISARKLVEATIRERMAVVTHAPVVLWKTDQNGIITLSEGKGLAQFGYQPGELEGVSIDSLEPRFPAVIAQTKFTLRTGQPFDIALEHDDYIFKYSGEPTFDNAGKVNGMIGVAVDISDRIHAEKAQNDLEKEKQLSQTRIQFFSMASHEFRTPLATILGTTQILETASTQIPPEKLQRNVSRIRNSANQINRLLTDILTINRAETGRLEFTPQPIDLLNFCQHLVEEIQIGVGIEHHIKFDREHWQASDDTAARIKVLADEQLLLSILNNLLSNAVKYSPPGSTVTLKLSQSAIAPEAQLALSKQVERSALTNNSSTAPEATLDDSEYDYWAVFQVGDQGRGISPEDQAQLFEVFFRGKNVDRIVGSGIGLTVVKKCVDIHNGEISVQSGLGQGTAFTVRIPVKEVTPNLSSVQSNA